MTSKQVVSRASKLSFVCDTLLQDGLQQAPVQLRKLARLKLRTHQWKLDAETMVEGVHARLSGVLYEQLTVNNKPPAGERVKQAVLCHDQYIVAARKYNRLRAVDAYVADCIDAVNQKLSAMKAQTEIVRVEAAAYIDPQPITKGRK